MNRLSSLFLAFLLVLPLSAASQQSYTELRPPLPVESQGKIEVLEFFWYGCIHCYNLQPHLETWIKTLPGDVELRRVPVVFNERWAHDAAIYYTLEAMGLVDKLHRPLFEAIHKNRLRTDNQAAFAEWLQQNGVDSKKFIDTVKSFGVQSKTRRAVQLTVAYKIDGTPAMAVNGRYTVSAEQGRTQQGILQAVNGLIERVRQEK